VPEGTTPDDATPIAGRECGTCTVCCTALTIDDPELQKVQGYRCKNLRVGGCGIYPTRPQACRAFFCGWRQLKWVRETLRPDTSGVLVRLHYEISQARGRKLGVMVTLLTDAAVKAEGLAETVAAAVAADIPVFLHVPGPPGYTAAEARMNDVLRDAVLTRDKAALLDILRRARAKGRAGKFKPVVLPRRQ
jgi:hypothetical protein